MGGAMQTLSSIVSLVKEEALMTAFTKPTYIPWIPGFQGINLEGGIGGAQPDELERNSILGPLIRPSLLPPNVKMVLDNNYKQMIEMAVNDANGAKSQGAYEKVV